MKRTLLVLTLVLALGIGSMVVFADTNITGRVFPGRHNETFTQEERAEWFKERTELRKEEIKKALEDGKITETQVKEWEEHFKDMEEFHKENGCLGGGLVRSNGMMKGNGHGRMMKGNKI